MSPFLSFTLTSKVYTPQPHQTGFSLIELMVVLTILGILSSMAIPSYSQYTQQAKATTALIGLQPWQTAITLCWQEHGTLTPCSVLGQAGIPQAGTPLPQGITALNAGSQPGSLRVTLDAYDAQSQLIEVESTPLITNNRLHWTLSCSDFQSGNSRVKYCQSALPGV